MKTIKVGCKRYSGSITLEAIVDDILFHQLNVYKWTLHSRGYASRTARDGGRLMHQMIATILGIEAKVIHHKNGNRLDNRLENLQFFKSQREHLQRHPRYKGNMRIIPQLLIAQWADPKLTLNLNKYSPINTRLIKKL